MKLYLLSQIENRGYDTYDSAIVAARDDEGARKIHPDPRGWKDPYETWANKPENVSVELIGTAKPGTKPGVILASFNAG